MNTKRTFGCVVLALVVPVAAADEPTTISGVKSVILRDSSPTPESAICIAALDARLSQAGFTVLDTTDGADAELLTAMSFAAEGRGLMGLTSSDKVKLTYSILIKSLPGHHLLFSVIDDTSDSLAVACQDAAKDTVEKILKAREPAAAPKAKKQKP